ncbi:hypothetical protein RHGRI_014631 [Rhododendron griersonianum]|uniref:Ankyrin repeat-containing protein n=1 Tax=Rhododendron griersonianum TaxID=479676 RepID=A0AAV6KAE5_9ERIC|nr:hypothetical protein RHGRI_014631 [Rhododendron griersonianum]
MEGVKDEYWKYIALLKAALRGDWDAARRFFVKDESAITVPITNVSETVLHIAVGIGERAIHFVEKLVVLMPVEALTLREKHGDTALHMAGMVGNTRATVVLVHKNPDLLYIRGRFFIKDESAITAPITNVSKTLLHIAVGTGERAIHILEKLVVLMPVEALTLRKKHGDTALHTAGTVGNMRAAVVLVQRNPDFLYIRGMIMCLCPSQMKMLFGLSIMQSTPDSMLSHRRKHKKIEEISILAPTVELELLGADLSTFAPIVELVAIGDDKAWSSNGAVIAVTLMAVTEQVGGEHGVPPPGVGDADLRRSSSELSEAHAMRRAAVDEGKHSLKAEEDRR